MRDVMPSSHHTCREVKGEDKVVCAHVMKAYGWSRCADSVIFNLDSRTSRSVRLILGK